MCVDVSVCSDDNYKLLKILDYLAFPLAPVMDLNSYRVLPPVFNQGLIFEREDRYVLIHKIYSYIRFLLT